MNHLVNVFKKHNYYYTILVYFILFSISFSCVSVKLGPKSGTPAKDLKYNKPDNPFEEVEVKGADKSFISNVTGNVISFTSDCSSDLDPSIDQLKADAISAMDSSTIQSEKKINFNNRQALYVQTLGELDGVSVKASILLFKKNKCNYTLTFVGAPHKLDFENSHFQNFLNSFKAP